MHIYIYIGQNFDFSELVGDRDWSCTERIKFKKKDTCNFILQNLKTCFLKCSLCNRCWAWCTKFYVILDHFLAFYPFIPPKDPKNQNFQKLGKKSGDIIILHRWTINGNRMIYSSWDMEHNGLIFLSFWPIFCTFTPW